MLYAFKCKRADYYFSNADYYDGVVHHPNETCAFILSALLSLRNDNKLNANQFNTLYIELSEIRSSEDISSKVEKLDMLMKKLVEFGIIYL